MRARTVTLSSAMTAIAVALGACSPPPVVASEDRLDAGPTTTLSGQVVYQGGERGDAIVFLYDASHPPPPMGTAHPLAFAQVSGTQLFAGALHDGSQGGPFAASYTFPTVAPGNYLVIAFLDHDDCITAPSASCVSADFDPFYSVTREPSGGDILGGHVDSTNEPEPVPVPEPEPGKALASVSGVQVGIGSTPLPDRPAFTISVDPAQVPVDAQGDITVSKTEPTFFAIAAAPISQPQVHEAQPVFLVRYVDDNHDGKPDLTPLGTPALWPKVFVRKIADADPSQPNPLVAAGLRDENDLDDNGVLDATGKSYEHLVVVDGGSPVLVPADSAPDLVLLPTSYVADPITSPQTAMVPSQIYAQLADGDGGPDMTKVIPMTELKLAVLPEAVDASGTVPVPLASIPPGRYAVIVEQYTGQSWRVPNELSSSIATSLGFQQEASQAFTFTVAQ